MKQFSKRVWPLYCVKTIIEGKGEREIDEDKEEKTDEEKEEMMKMRKEQNKLTVNNFLSEILAAYLSSTISWVSNTGVEGLDA